MPQGLMIYKSNGVLWFDSMQTNGGIVADLREFQAGDSGTLTYPQFAGRSVKLGILRSPPLNHGLSVDTALGYPRVTITTAGFLRRFIVFVY